MWEMYFITRLDALYTMFSIFLALSIVGVIAGFIVYYANKAAMSSDCRYNTKEYVTSWMSTGKVWFRSFAISLIFSILGIVLIPSTKEALMIFGIGTTYEYLKSSEATKQLPDKTVEFLNAWIDKETKEMQEYEDGR